ncbi:tetratricopeptide repeat-containing sensor histidine kinase [Mucilaginibacter terrae]|uniref:histidine kinase n=1 Tax=Mucilaginibacter terrae TaxID=1955052 RepID=A0ABU3GSL5_9SPHI|nr:tetratricopeptide repeat-containing sensor histidine kinase [Mucilaginibacter terrae]MDT3402764.1 two-component system sensor histidine kinase/response regulator [Mucilaginibacter terrae]
MRSASRVFKYTSVTGSLLLCIVCLLTAQVYAQQVEKPTKRIIAHVDSLNNVKYPLVKQDAGKAFTLLNEAEILATEYNYTTGLAVTYLNQADLLNQQGYAKRALELYYRSMQLSQKSNDVYNIARAEQHISTIKRNDGSYKEAEKLLNNTLKVFKQLNKPEDIINTLLKLGLLKTQQMHFDDALAYFNQAQALSRKSSYSYGEKKSYYNRALLYHKINKSDSAVYNLNKALLIDIADNDILGRAQSYLELSRIYKDKADNEKATTYAHLAYAASDSAQAPSLLRNAVQLLLRLSRAKLDKDAVIQWQEELIFIDNQIAERERRESNNFIDALRSQQEQQIKVQERMLDVSRKSEQQKTLIALYTGFLLVFVVIVFMLSYNYKKAKRFTYELNLRKEKIEQQVALLDQMNGEMMQTNQQLEDDNELKSKLLSIITHDLRKPLANTQSIIHLLNMDLVTMEEAHELFAQLEAQYTRVINLTDNLLFWIRGQVSGAAVDLKPVNLHTVADAIIEEQKIPSNDKNLTISNNVDEDLTWLTETETIRIVFRNLLNNAIKFTPHGGLIQVYSETTDAETCVTVKDSGIGISEDVMNRINSKNYYTTKGTQNEEGSGFGLMLIRDLLKRHEGTLKINSEPGKGSSFTISFPVTAVITDDRFVS